MEGLPAISWMHVGCPRGDQIREVDMELLVLTPTKTPAGWAHLLCSAWAEQPGNSRREDEWDGRFGSIPVRSPKGCGRRVWGELGKPFHGLGKRTAAHGTTLRSCISGPQSLLFYGQERWEVDEDRLQGPPHRGDAGDVG